MRTLKSLPLCTWGITQYNEGIPDPPPSIGQSLPSQPAETNVRSRLWTSYQQLAKRGRDFSTNNHFFTVGEGLVHIVSMGHRLQTISYTQENSTVK